MGTENRRNLTLKKTIMINSNPYAPPQADLGKTSFKIYPTKDMLNQLDMTWLCCYFYVICIVSVGAYVFVLDYINPYTFRDIASLIFYSVAGYFIHQRRFIWAPIALAFYVLDKLLFWPNFGVIGHWALQLPFFAGFLSGTIAYVRYHFHQKKKASEYAQARIISDDDGWN